MLLSVQIFMCESRKRKAIPRYGNSSSLLLLSPLLLSLLNEHGVEILLLLTIARDWFFLHYVCFYLFVRVFFCARDD